MTPWKRTLAIMFFAQLVSATGFAVIFPFLPLYVQQLGSSTGTSLELLAGLVFSSQALTMMLASPFWGALADRYGRKLMVERATFGGAVILLLMAFPRSAEELVLLRTVQGLITGTIAAANALVAAAVPRERVGYAMGILQVGLWAGVALGPLIGGLMADTLGFRATFILTAALLLVAGVLVRVGIKEVFTPPAPTAQRPSMLANWRALLATPGVLLIYGVRLLSGLSRSMLLPILPLVVQRLLPGSAQINTFTGLVVGVASAAGTASAVYLGRLGDRVGHRRVLVSCALAAALLYLPQAFVFAAWQLLVLQALAGAALGGVEPAISALLARHTHAGSAGAVYGLDNAVVSGARSVAPLAGALAAIAFGPSGVFGATALALLATALLAFWGLPAKPASQ